MSQLPVIFLAFANDKVDEAAYLRNLPKELDAIRQALYSAQQMNICEVVERANATIGQVVSVFQDSAYKDRIAIFHYGGHATGDQLLLESLDGGVAAGSSEGLVPFLARQHALQLVFINGCSSEPQAQEMIEAGIPAVIGTSRAINDVVATQLSTRFYKGLAAGASLEKAWHDAIDEAKMGTEKGNYRGLFYKKKDTPTDRFPWNMMIREGAEKVKEWNLPQATGDSLFGLPPIPPTYNLPEEPFLFFRWYQRPEAEVFFGRGSYIRDMYHRVVDGNSPPLILLYGQSGVGKSSLFDAGLRPRLELTHEVVYIRRDPNRGLVASLMRGLSEMPEAPAKQEISKGKETLSRLQSPLKTLIDNINETLEAIDSEAGPEEQAYLTQLQAMQRHGTGILEDLNQQNKGGHLDSPEEKLELLSQTDGLLFQWLSRETQTGKPLVIILDQVEEAFTRPLQRTATEMEDFWSELAKAFRDVRTLPMGKLILGYRKEYHPEIDDACKSKALPRSQVFLEPLKKEDVMEVISGLSTTDRLRQRYHLSVEPSLPLMMATDLVEDPDSPVAPILQILVTKMWQQAKAADPSHPEFTESLYLRLKQEGILLKDFFDQQMDTLKTYLPEAVNSGLVLDFLHLHTTRLGTSGSRTMEEIRELYGDREMLIQQLAAKCRDLYLISNTGDRSSSLTHDTLAPLVIKAYRDSDLPGQRAIRILENKMFDYEKAGGVTLDPADLALVEKGENGMRTWAAREQDLVRESRIRREKEEAARKRRRLFAIIGVAAIALLGLISFLLKLDADKSRDQAVMDRMKADSARLAALRSDSLTHIQKDSTTLALTMTKRTQDSLRVSDSLKEIERIRAIFQARIANAGKEVMASRLYLSEGDQLNALRFASDGYRKDPSPEAKAALLEAYHFSPLAKSVHTFKDRINDMVIDVPTGNIAVATEGYEVYLMSPKGKILGKQSHNAPVNSLAIKDRILVSASQDGTLIRWDLRSGTATRSPGLGGTLVDVALSPGRNAMAVIVKDSVKILTKNFELEASFSYPNEELLAVAFSPDGENLAIGDRSGHAWLCNRIGEKLMNFVGADSGAVKNLTFSEDGSWVLAAFANKTPMMWKVDGSAAHPAAYPEEAITQAIFFENSRYVATASSDRNIRIWSHNSNLLLALNDQRNTQMGEVTNALAFNPKTRLLYSGNSNGSLISWEIESRLKNVLAINDRENVEQSGKVVFADWKRNKLVAATEGTFIEWSPSGNLPPVYFPINENLKGAGLHPSGNSWSWASSNAAYLWRDRMKAPVALNAPEKMSRNSSVATTRRFFAFGGRKSVYLWDWNGNILSQKSIEKEIATDLIASPDGRYLVASTEKSKLFLWDIQKDKDLSQSLKGVEGKALAFHPSSKKILVASGSTAKEYAVNNPQSNILISQTNLIQCADYSPDGKYLVTGDAFGIWQVWYRKGETFLLLFSHEGHQGRINNISFSPDGKYIVTTSDDFLVKVWPIDPDLIIKLSTL